VQALRVLLVPTVEHLAVDARVEPRYLTFCGAECVYVVLVGTVNAKHVCEAALCGQDLLELQDFLPDGDGRDFRIIPWEAVAREHFPNVHIEREVGVQELPLLRLLAKGVWGFGRLERIALGIMPGSSRVKCVRAWSTGLSVLSWAIATPAAPATGRAFV
jgi:hypothetical protein